MKHILLFIKKYYIQMGRKWLSLPFLLLLPIVAIGLIAFILVSFFQQEDQSPIEIGIVDIDQSDETQLLGTLMEESSQLSTFIQLSTMPEETAIQSIEKNELGAYIIFPDGFTDSLYTGKSVDLSIIGNSERPTESYMITEFINSVSRQIRDAQANILTLNDYARESGMPDEERNDFVFQQFTEFVFLTLGRETMIHDRTIINQTTSTPLSYYGIGSWYMISSLWLLIIYLFLTKKEQALISKRTRLYGVTELQQILAKLFVIFTVVSVLTFSAFIILYQLLELQLATENIIRLGIINLFHHLALLSLLAIMEVLISQEKLRMLVQSGMTILLLGISGAIIPTIYFPLWMQHTLPYLFSAEAFHWLTELILNQRFYVDYIPLFLMNGALLFILIAISIMKERVYE